MTPLEQLEQKIRQSIPELKEVSITGITRTTQIMLNHVLEYLRWFGVFTIGSNKDLCRWDIPLGQDINTYLKWNLKSAYIKDQSDELINFLNELK